MIDAGKMSTASDCTELKEVYFLQTFGDTIGSHCLQERIVGQPYEDSAHFDLTTADECEYA